MNRIKALMTGMACISFCMANISGIVTDTGTTPVPGATVQLEIGGQTVTTEADGKFSLVIGTAAAPENGERLPGGSPARVSGKMLNITIAARASVEVAMFDLNGKSVSTMQTTLDAGFHCIMLPQQSAGVYLLKVKIGNEVFLIKGTGVGNRAGRSSATIQRPSTNSLAKQMIVKGAINDVISVIKNGYLNYRVVVKNSDTGGITIKMIASAGTVTDGDGNVYQTVRIGRQEWMAENLRTTRYIDGTPIPFENTWYYPETPVFCYFGYKPDANRIKKFGALYNWYVIDPKNTNKIAPSGWHVPTNADWDTLQEYLIAAGYNWDGTSTGNKIAKAMAAGADWVVSTAPGAVGNNQATNNRSGFSALPSGSRSSGGSFAGENGCSWWSSTVENGTAFDRDLYPGYDEFIYHVTPNEFGISIRLVKD